MGIGFHASHEQFAPSDLLELVQKAEMAGFSDIMSSDHISPWNRNQGNSGFAWSWLGAAMQSTKLPFGSLAIPGGWRYHPVVLAQAIATLAEMFPNRMKWIAAGSGEAVNENMIGQGWPEKDERNARLLEGVQIMRALWRGETVTKETGFIKADRARIWSLPKTFPKILGAALTPETARWAGSWADGLITVRQPIPDTRKMIDAFYEGGGHGKPIIMQMHVSWAETNETARLQAWDQWKSNTVGPYGCANFKTPEEFEEKTKNTPMEKIDENILISSDLDQHTSWIKEYLDLGIQDIFIHNAGRNQREFIQAYGQNVLKKF